MRLAMEREAIYASKYPFIDYGIDLHVMAEFEKGVRIDKMTVSDYDTKPSKEHKKFVDHY